MEVPPNKKMRIDKWLKVTRIFKTRSKAAEACDLGKVTLNEKSCKAAKTVKVGDSITVKFKFKKRTYDILELTSKSISKEKAKLLYFEHEPSEDEKLIEEQREMIYRASRNAHPKFRGRPTKKERRKFTNIRGH